MRTRLIATVSLALLAGGVAMAGAQTPQPQPERRQRAERASFQARLGLSDAQMAELRRQRSVQRKETIRRRADLAIARMDLEEALEAPTVDEKLVSSRVRALTELQAAAVRARVDARLALRKVLTPEQLEKMKQLRHERGQNPRAAWRRGGRPGDPAGSPEADDPRAEDPAGPGR